MTTQANQQTAGWHPLILLGSYMGIMSSLVLCGIWLAYQLPSAWVVFLAGISILLLLGLLVARFINRLSMLQHPLMVLVCLVSGLMLAQLITAPAQAYTALIVLGVNLLCLGILTSQRIFAFQRFNLLLAVLAICFSFIGMILIFVQVNTAIQLIWLIAGSVCLDILLYTLLQQILQTEDESVFTLAIGVVLLQIALFMNLLLIFSQGLQITI
ncbi:MAG: hypothetical protein AAFR81_18860 [Chloroflexota bacterium]